MPEDSFQIQTHDQPVIKVQLLKRTVPLLNPCFILKQTQIPFPLLNIMFSKNTAPPPFISHLTLHGSSIQRPSASTPLTILNLRFQFTIKWKSRELPSPSLIHLVLAFCFRKDSFECAATHSSSCSCFRNLISCSFSCLSSPSFSSLFNSNSSLNFCRISQN